MNIAIDCLPCFVNQSLKTCKSLKLGDAKTRRILSRILAKLSEFDQIAGTILMAREIQRILREETGVDDLFYEQKKHANKWMKTVLSEMFPSGKPDNFKQALKLAVAGNIIDLGAIPDLSAEQVTKTLENVHKTGFSIDHSEELLKAIDKAENILYVGDNAGEIVFDKMLISILPTDKITFATRGKPVLNDITKEDAESVGMSELVKVVDSGVAIPGVVIDECSDEFKTVWQKADLIIAKGQGNFESLCEDSSKDIFFLFMAKCQRVAKIIDRKIGDYIVLRQNMM